MEIAIGQAVEVCIGRMDGGAGQLIRAASNLNIRLNELDGCEGAVVGVSGNGKAICAVVNVQSRSPELAGRYALPAEILKPIPAKA